MIRVICVGRIKEKYLSDAILEYSKRIKKYTNLEIIELSDSSIENPKLALEQEAVLINRHIKDKDFVITLEIEGNELSSIEFSKKINQIQILNSNIVFVIGGSYGIDQQIKNRANYKISFSRMTFPHQLFRVILLEQIFRAYKILNNEKYHK